MMKTGKSIDWWEDNAKPGDVFRISVSDGTTNDWQFGRRKTSTSPREAVNVYFDHISYPDGDIEGYFAPAPVFQRSKENLGNKSTGFPLELEDFSMIISHNGEKVAKTYHSTKHHSQEPEKKRGGKKAQDVGFEVQEMNGRYVCPCYEPQTPDKFSYSQKGHAIWNHKKHIGMRE